LGPTANELVMLTLTRDLNHATTDVMEDRHRHRPAIDPRLALAVGLDGARQDELINVLIVQIQVCDRGADGVVRSEQEASVHAR
jgi:hypothetical protein